MTDEEAATSRAMPATQDAGPSMAPAGTSLRVAPFPPDRTPALPLPHVPASLPTPAPAMSTPAPAMSAPTPAPSPAPRFVGALYRHPSRRYQGLAIDAFERARAAGRNRAYIVMPPGAGKTVVGLEIARRLGRTTGVLGPNTAIQAQWVAQWADFNPPSPAGTSPDLAADLTVLTYQALCTLDDDDDGLDELAAGATPPRDDGDPATAPPDAESATPAPVNPHARADAAFEPGFDC